MSEFAWFDKGDGRQVYRRVELPAPDRFSDFPCPRIAGDSMAPVQSMLDGKLYDSKSALRRTYKAAGVTEVGNDPARLRLRQKPKVDKQSIKDSLDKAEARFNRGERAA